MAKKNNQNIFREPGYISLTEAAKISPYSQEYLSLLSRRGKLKAKKFGRNWYTTKEALQDYIKEQGIPLVLPKTFFAKTYRGRITKPVFAALEKIEEQQLPQLITEPKIEASDISLVPVEFITKPVYQKSFLANLLIFSIIILTGTIFYFSLFSGISKDFKDYGKWVLENSKDISQKTLTSFFGTFVQAPEEPGEEEFPKVSPKDIFLFERDFGNLEENIVGDVKGRFDGFRNEFGMVKPGEVEEKQGVVVMPLDENGKWENLTKEEIKKGLSQAFSDKVDIQPDEDKRSGIIKPVFAAPLPEKQEYLYLMTPIKKE